ncbi:Wzz/FepE/Etk N-terminal domain-containing protein [Staphylococcus canis]|uniref:Capsule biosynthesis protein CapA n=1 Tax=Staphylococcus canis TaxID=2724942 RepID=A0ABS0TA27_9STAP|nr:Wzz/FepE/Etk N-terminal domain-containing protein [Staphylococcus canis]MBI5975595.1 capsule biosynthesis protein CapA [Staphylococcus canis]
MEETIDLSQLLNILRRHLKVLIILPLLCLIISALVTFFVLTPKYEASTQILVNQNETDSEFNSQSIQNNLQLVNTYAEIVKSPRILDDVSKQLTQRYEYDELNRMVNVTHQTESQIINISVTHESPREAENIANAIAQVYRDEMPHIMNIDNVSILSEAKNDADKVAPKTIVNLVVGWLIGFVIALLIIFIKELLDRRIQSEEAVETYLELPVLGTIEKF